MCDENDEGLDSAAAIAFGNLLCEKKPIDWCEAQSRNPTACLVIKLLRAKAKRESMPADELKNKDINPDEVWRLLGQCELTALPDHDNRKLLVRHSRREPASCPNRKPERYERLLRDEPLRVYVPLMLRPWVMDRTHKEAVHLGEKVNLAMLKRYYYWVGMASSVKCWIGRCYACQARKKMRDTVRWPFVSLPLPSSPGQMVAFDLLGPFPRTNRGRRRHKVTQTSWYTTISRDGVALTPSSTVCREIFRMLGAVKRFTSSAHAQTNGVYERLNHTLCQILSHLIADNQTNWDELLLRAIAALSNGVSRGTGLAPNEVHIGRYPRLPMTILEGRGARNHQGRRRDQLDFLKLIRERQNRAYELVRKEDFFIKAKH